MTATGRHRLRAAGEGGGAPALPATAPAGGPETTPVIERGPWHSRRPQPRRSAFRDTDDRTAGARPTILMRPVRD